MTIKKQQLFLIPIVLSLLTLSAPAQSPGRDESPLKMETITVKESKAFLILPPDVDSDKPIPWIWYAPTLLPRYPGAQEKWMIGKFQDAGIAIAGIDVGESYGSPKGRAIYQAFYEELTKERGFDTKPVLLARSRGGLMLYNWAVEHPDSVGGIAGIYPVCNLASYPGLAKAAPAYELTAEELEAKLAEHNPIDRLAPLAKVNVPIYHLQGDSDKVVPLEANSGELAKRYKALGGPVKIEVIEGQGHNVWPGWFHSDSLTDFVIENAGKSANDAENN